MGFRPRAIPLHKGRERLLFRHAADFERWLRRNHRRDESMFVQLAKKHSLQKSVTYEQARELAIRFGWIDGLVNRLDDDYYLVLFSPRRKRSLWSAINRDIAEQLIADGRMEPAGQAQVDAAIADGRWQRAYGGASTMVIPEDFEAAAAANKRAKKTFASLSEANRYAIAVQLITPPTDAIRAKRFDKLLAMLERGEVPHPGA